MKKHHTLFGYDVELDDDDDACTVYVYPRKASPVGKSGVARTPSYIVAGFTGDDCCEDAMEWADREARSLYAQELTAQALYKIDMVAPADGEYWHWIARVIHDRGETCGLYTVDVTAAMLDELCGPNPGGVTYGSDDDTRYRVELVMSLGKDIAAGKVLAVYEVERLDIGNIYGH
jgi:hypothetical protein